MGLKLNFGAKFPNGEQQPHTLLSLSFFERSVGTHAFAFLHTPSPVPGLTRAPQGQGCPQPGALVHGTSSKGTQHVLRGKWLSNFKCYSRT